MTPRPTIDTFVMPLASQLAPPALLMCLLFFATSSGGAGVRSRVGGWRSVYAGWALMIVAHIFEASYTRVLCRRHKTSARHAVRRCFDPSLTLQRKWIALTAIFGFPAIQTFRRLVREARIASLTEAAGAAPDKSR